MKHFRNFAFGLCSAQFVMALALPSPATGQNEPNTGHAGYQGIPLRDGSDLRAKEQTDSSNTQRYPALPRRQNETDLNAVSVTSGQGSSQNDQDSAGYRGIPRSNSSDDVQRKENSDPKRVEPSGYSGIPRAASSGETQLVAQRSSSLVNPKSIAEPPAMAWRYRVQPRKRYR